MGDLDGLIRDRVLMISYGGGHAAMLAPVAAELRERSVPIAVLALTTAPMVFQRFGLETYGIADIVDHVHGYERAREVGARITREQQTSPLISRAETEAYFGVNYTDLVKDYGPTDAELRFRRMGRQGFLPKAFFRQLFAQGRPRCVVATNSPRSERAALEIASDAKISSLCLVDLYARWEIEWCSQPGYADRICVLNQTVADRFANRGVPRASIAVTGNPAFDRLRSVDPVALRKTYRARHSIAGKDRVIVFISQPEPEVHPFSGQPGSPDLPVRIEKTLIDSFAADADTHLVLRLHPSETREPQASGERIIPSLASEALDEVICAADCVVTSSSTVGLEAGLLGIPVIQTMLSVFSADLPLAEMGYAREVSDIADLADAIRKVLAAGSPTEKRPLAKAAPKVAQIIQEITEQ